MLTNANSLSLELATINMQSSTNSEAGLFDNEGNSVLKMER